MYSVIYNLILINRLRLPSPFWYIEIIQDFQIAYRYFSLEQHTGLFFPSKMSFELLGSKLVSIFVKKTGASHQ